MLLNCDVGEDSWESLGLQGDPILKELSPECSLEGLMRKLKLQYFGHLMWRTDSLERPWCWEGLKAGGEGDDDRGWNVLMASPTQWTWVWVSFRSWWWTGKPGVLQSMGLQRVGHDWATELNWPEVLNSANSFVINTFLTNRLQIAIPPMVSSCSLCAHPGTFFCKSPWTNVND